MLSTVIVNTELDGIDFNDSVTSLREAIFATNTVPGADVIVFDFGHDGPATIRLEHGELEITDPLSILGLGAGQLIIDAQQNSRIFNITTKEGDHTIAGMALVGGKTTGNNLDDQDITFSGGAIRSLTVGMLTIENCEIRSNLSTGNWANGGGIFVVGDVSISSSMISGNSAGGEYHGYHGFGRGGGVSGGTVTVTSSTISDNSASYGSGIYSTGTLTVMDSTISENLADYRGGGIYSTGALTVINSKFLNNSVAYGDGGGIYSIGTLTITNSTLSDNSANENGGGIYNSGSLTMANSRVSDNSTSYSGGGIFNFSGILMVMNSTIQGNSASFGGGIYNSGMLTVISSTILDNSVSDEGGGIFNGYSGTLKVVSSTISGNITTWRSRMYISDGGGIHNSGTLSIIDSTIASNSTAGSGGGIYNSYGTLEVTNSTISGNSAAWGIGGGILNSSTMTIRNSTIVDNGADWGFGGIYSNGNLSSATLNNTIVARNIGPDINNSNGTLSGFHNLIGDGSGQSALVNSIDGNLVGTSSFPIDPNLSDATQFENGTWGYYLLPVSLALDAGDNELAVDLMGEPLTEDIQGNARIQNGTVDIGAVEGVIAGSPAQTYLVTSLEKTIVNDGILTFIEAFEAANGNRAVGDAPAGSFSQQDIIRFADGLSGTILVDDGELAIVGDLSIESLGAELLVFDAAGQSRVFLVQLNVAVDFYGITITGGAAIDGGGIYNWGTLTVNNSTLSDNLATGSSKECGGGIYSSGMLTVTNSTIAGNFAYNGGGIYNTGILSVTNSTIWGNMAISGEGGGISTTGNSSINNTIVAGNGASDILDIKGTLSGYYNLIGNGSGQSALIDGINGNLVGTLSSPIDPLLSDLSQFDNGVWGHYLLPGSPALDAGDNALAVNPMGEPLTEDMAGNARIQNGTVDIGAVEGVTAGSPAQIYLVTSLEKTIAEDGVLTFIEAFEAANRNKPMGAAPAGSFSQQDTIQIAEGVTGTVLLDDGALVIVGDLSIEGPGAEHMTFQTHGQNRVFLVWPSVSVHLYGMTITGGLADSGGGICNYGTLTVTNSTIANNSAFGGGGIYNQGTLTVTNSTIAGNSASDGGGGIWNYGTLTVTNSTVADNSANSGGGIWNYGTLTVTNSTIADNSAGIGGGISNRGTLTVTNSTLAGNSADYGGDGIYLSGSSSVSTLNNTIVAGNGVISGGSDIYCEWDILSGSYNLIGNGSNQSALVDGVNGNQVGTFSSPIDPLLSNSWRLLPGSPASNAGSNALAVDAQGNLLTTDLDGKERIIYGTVDIGAYEFGLVADADMDGDVDSQDLNAWQNGFGIQTEATYSDGDADADGDVDGNDFLAWQLNFSGNTASATAAKSPSRLTATDHGSGAFLSKTNASSDSTNNAKGDPADLVRSIVGNGQDTSIVPLDRQGTSFESVDYAGWSLLQPMAKTNGNSTAWLGLPQFQSRDASRQFQHDRAVDTLMSRLDERMRQIGSERVHDKVADIAFTDFATVSDDTWMVGRTGKTSLQKLNNQLTVTENRLNMEVVLEELAARPLLRPRDVLQV